MVDYGVALVRFAGVSFSSVPIIPPFPRSGIGLAGFVSISPLVVVFIEADWLGKSILFQCYYTPNQVSLFPPG